MAQVDELNNELVLSLKIRVLPPSPISPTLSFSDLVVDSVLPEVFIIKVSGAVIWLNFWIN